LLVVNTVINEYYVVWLGTYNIVTATVKNVGNGSAGTFNVTLNDGSGVVDEVVVTGLGAGASTEVMFVWVPTTSGGYTLNATVDANNDVAEWNENNNTKTKSVTASEIPPTDLVVSEVFNGNLINGTANEVFAAVKNEGAYASGFNVSLEADGVEVDKAFVPMLHFRESQLVTFRWTPTSEGSVQLNVTVDSDGQIAESDESNNAASQASVVALRIQQLNTAHHRRCRRTPYRLIVPRPAGCNHQKCRSQGSQNAICKCRSNTGSKPCRSRSSW